MTAMARKNLSDRIDVAFVSIDQIKVELSSYYRGIESPTEKHIDDVEKLADKLAELAHFIRTA